MGERKLYLGEVGFCSVGGSITGVSWKSNKPFQIPRVLFMLPNPEEPRDYQDMFIKRGGLCIEGDVYQPIVPISLAFLGMENVLNDPDFRRQNKDVEQLARNVIQNIVPGGILLVIDSINANIKQTYDPIYDKLVRLLLNDFDLIVNELSDTNLYKHETPKSKLKLALNTLTSFDVTDQLIINALSIRAHPSSIPWLMMQKKYP